MWSHLIGRSDVLILDTETTGLHKNSEIVDLAIIDTTGRTVMDVPVMPQGYIPAGASKVHGLTRPRLKALGARPWPDHHEAFLSTIRSAAVVCVYNLAFDMRMLEQTMGRYGLDDEGVLDQVSEKCIMLDLRPLAPHSPSLAKGRLQVAHAGSGLPPRVRKGRAGPPGSCRLPYGPRSHANGLGQGRLRSSQIGSSPSGAAASGSSWLRALCQAGLRKGRRIGCCGLLRCDPLGSDP